MRLIDADALINTLVNACDNDQSKFFPVWIEKQIDAQPTVAMLKEQEIVRCKDCKHSFDKDGTYYCSSLLSDRIALVVPDWFCADGEPKDKQLAHADNDTAQYADSPTMMSAT